MSCLLAITMTVHKASAQSGIPQEPTVLFEEDFENRQANSNIMLPDYTGTSGMTYSADPYWVSRLNCNGFIIDQQSPREPDDCDAVGNGANHYNNVTAIPYALGEHNGAADPATNAAAASYTAGSTADNEVQFRTDELLTLPTAGRFVTFSVDAGAMNCQATHPLLRFYLVDENNTELPVGAGPINACTDPGGTVHSVPRQTGELINVRVGTYTADGALLMQGSELGVVMRNENGDGAGNDGAYDNIRILDVTPQLHKEFESATATVGNAVTLTFTITNTSDLLAKAGWSFTDILPDGLVVADPASVETTCTNGTVTADPGTDTITVSGDLNDGQEFCTVSVDVTSSTSGVYENCDTNISDTVGITPEGCASVTFEELEPWVCTPDGILSQSTPSIVYAIDLVTGDFTELTEEPIYGGNINAIGYNVLDGYIYGHVQTGLPNQIVRVGADGSVQELGYPDGVPATGRHIGDVDENGHYWISNGANWWQIDLAAWELIDSGPVQGGGIASWGFADWVYVPNDQNSLYTVATNSSNSNIRLYRFDREDKVFENMGGLGTQNGGAGAIFADADGFIYTSVNANGNIHRINPLAVTREFFASGPASGQNDGAMCIEAAIRTDFGDAPESYDTLLEDDGPRHGLRDYDPVTNTTSLMLGTQVDHETDGQPSEGADQDGFNDGVADPIVLVSGEQTVVTVTVTNNTSEPATLVGWIDLEATGAFDEDDRSLNIVSVPAGSGTDDYELTFAATNPPDLTYARFRVFPGEVDEEDLSPHGPASAGEVEDYQVTSQPLMVEFTGEECWRMLSSPVSTTFAELLADFRTQGIPGSDDPGATPPNIYLWPNDADGNDVTGWTPPADMDQEIPAGQGFIFSVVDHDGTGFPKTLSIAGSAHPAPVEPDLNQNPDGWSLVGNPFGVPVAFDELQTTDLTGVAYVYDRAIDNWRTTDGSIGEIHDGTIAAFQGFFVQNDGDTPSLVFTEDSKTTGGEFYGKESTREPAFVRLELQGQGVMNSAWVTFSQAGSFERIRGDAWQLTPFADHYALLATRKAGEGLFDIAHFPASDQAYEIPLHMEATRPGTYSVSATDLELPDGLDVVFIDRHANRQIPLGESFSYEFTIAQEQVAKTDPAVFTASGPSCSDQVASLVDRQMGPQAAKTAGEEPDRFVLAVQGAGGSGALPTRVALLPNYPNPFNPVTEIRFELPATSDVTLEVYDILGRRVATLVDETVPAGTRTVTFDARGLASGVYLTRLQVSGPDVAPVVEVQKMTLVRRH